MSAVPGGRNRAWSRLAPGVRRGLMRLDGGQHARALLGVRHGGGQADHKVAQQLIGLYMHLAQSGLVVNGNRWWILRE